MRKPLFSITTPCFNSVNTIERTIQSVLAQKYTDYEYIIIDGGSTDGTLEIIKKYEPFFEGRMSWYSEPDKGIYDAFNKGVKASIGYFTWNVNSDDWIEAEALDKVAPLLLPYKDEVCICCFRYFKHLLDGGIIKSPFVTQDSISKAGNSLLCMGIPHPASIYSRHVFDEVGYYDDRYYISGDQEHFFRCYRSGKVSFILFDMFITNMAFGGVSTTFNFVKNMHDWELTYSIYCKNRTEKTYKLYRRLIRYLLNYIRLNITK